MHLSFAFKRISLLRAALCGRQPIHRSAVLRLCIVFVPTSERRSLPSFFLLSLSFLVFFTPQLDLSEIFSECSVALALERKKSSSCGVCQSAQLSVSCHSHSTRRETHFTNNEDGHLGTCIRSLLCNNDSTYTCSVCV